MTRCFYRSQNVQNPLGTIGGWVRRKPFGTTCLTLYGYGSDANVENRKVPGLSRRVLRAFGEPMHRQRDRIPPTLKLSRRDPAPNFPGVGFPASGLGRFLTKEEAGIATGHATVSNGVVTWVDGQYFPLTMPAGVKFKLGGSWYTVASVDSGTQITLVERGITISGSTPFQTGGFGLRIRKKTTAGTVNFNASLASGVVAGPCIALQRGPGPVQPAERHSGLSGGWPYTMNPPQQGNFA